MGSSSLQLWPRCDKCAEGAGKTQGGVGQAPRGKLATVAAFPLRLAKRPPSIGGWGGGTRAQLLVAAHPAKYPARRDGGGRDVIFSTSFLVCAPMMMIGAARATQADFPIALAVALARLP
jgi:hypothetical protein